MKVIRIKAKQTMVNYRRPMCYLSGETYPLPPYSTIIGMIHNACGFTEYHPMKISIQGDPRSTVLDVQTKYTGGSIKYEKGRHNSYAVTDNEKVGYSKGPGYVQLITDIDLIIHILPEKEEELELIFQGLYNPQKYLALGRYEDLLNIVDVSIIECTKKDSAITTHNMYFAVENDYEIQGTIYNLKKVYRIDPKTNIRSFQESYKVRYIPQNVDVSNAFIDNEQNVLWLV